MSHHLMPFVFCSCEMYIEFSKTQEGQNIMNNSILTAYSSLYSTAMLQDAKPANYAATANRNKESRFSALVKLLRRA